MRLVITCGIILLVIVLIMCAMGDDPKVGQPPH